MLCSCKLYFFVIFTIFHKHSSAQLHMSSGKENEHVQKSDDRMTDNLAEGDEHHKIVILVPQFLNQEKKKPKSHHHHHKVLPVVHSGKVIHAHHHHGKVDHVHGHKGDAKHHHQHHLSANHKHHHHGVGSHKHSHVGKTLHDHKHAGKAHHKHGHVGKGTIHHVHGKHHHHHPPPPPPKKPKKKFTNPFAFGGGFDPNEAYVDATPRVKIDSEILRALNPAAVSSSYVNRPHSPRIIQIRIPDENENVVKEIDIDTQSDLAVLKKNYIAYADDGDDNYGDNIDLTANLDELGDETEDTDGGSESEFQLAGDAYKFAATATQTRIAAEDSNPVYNVFDRGEGAGIEQILPSAGHNNGIAYSDSFRYQ